MRNRAITTGLAVFGCALALAACGSSKRPGGQSGAGAPSALKFADCMRTHGVPNFPDPGARGGAHISLGPGFKTGAPAFMAAQRACGGLITGGGTPRPPVSAAHKLAMLRLSECMRAHGVTGFPDPTSTPPVPGPGSGIAFGGPGSFIGVQQAVLAAPAFKAAAAVCGFPGVGKQPQGG